MKIVNIHFKIYEHLLKATCSTYDDSYILYNFFIFSKDDKLLDEEKVSQQKIIKLIFIQNITMD